MRNYKLFLFACALVSCLSISVLPQNSAPIGIRPEPPVGKGVVALRAARLIDGTGAPPITNAVVIVTDNKITAVGDANSVRIPPGAKVIDLGDVTLLPGFIDADPECAPCARHFDGRIHQRAERRRLGTLRRHGPAQSHQ